MCQEDEFWNDLKSGKFAMMVKESARGQRLVNSKDVFHATKPLFAEHDDVETLYGIFLNARNRVLAIEKLSTGSISSATIYPRELIKRILALKCAALVMVHNHPSGDTEPSREDFTITTKVGIALDSIGVTLHDHIIVGDSFHSMADTGWLRTMKEKISALAHI